MGNTQSITNNNIDLKNTVDTIASKYILSQKFQDLINIKDKNYCKNLVILTSKILDNNLNRQQITYLAQYQQGDKIIYKLDNDDVLYFENSELDKIDEQNSIKKNRMCIGISAFYLKINYIFSAILTTLKPLALIKDTDSDELDTVAADVDNFENETNEENLKTATEYENKNDETSDQAQEISDPNTDDSTNAVKNSTGGNPNNNILNKFDLLSSNNEEPEEKNTTQKEDTSQKENTSQKEDTSQKENTSQEDNKSQQEEDNKSQQEEDNTQQEEYNKSQQEEDNTQQEEDNTSQQEEDNKSQQEEDNTQQKEDNTSQQEDNKSQQEEDNTQQEEDNTQQEEDNKISENKSIDSYFNVETTKNSTLPSDDNKILLGFISVNSLCGKRIANLMNINSNFNIENFDVQKYDTNSSSEININPTVCNPESSLQHEIGIPELERLYYDLFNFKFGTFNNMSQSAQTDYNNDLLDFYNVFTGSSITNISELKNLNPPITKFSDIQIDYKNILKNTCDKYDNKKNISGRSRDFREYAVRLQTMIKNTKANQDKLLDILNQLFYVKKNNYPIEITINKNLNNQSLDKLVVETRLLIKNMYIQCDKDYRNVLKIFQIIVDKLELTTLTRQEEQMNNLSESNIQTQEDTDANELIQIEQQKTTPSEEDENKPSEEDENKPSEEDENKPSEEDENKPSEEDENKPSEEDENKPSEEDENKPSEDENKPSEDENKPSEQEEVKPSEQEENKKTSNDSQLSEANTEINFDKNKNSSEESKGGKYKKTKTHKKKHNKKSKKK
uniref:Uncharacterized protein n=1 Tax=Nucleocytoviricota sp. TaxID=2809609 RepID=A0A9E8G523_9VIRU|nr:hypothetical protein [Nucleocytoviricota sp.]